MRTANGSGEPRRHHRVPEFYLQRFGDDAEQIRVAARDRRTAYTTSVTRAATERDYYTVETTTGERSQDVERLLARIETHGATALLLAATSTLARTELDARHQALRARLPGHDHRH